MRNFVLIIPMLLVATPALADDGYINANVHVLAGDDIVTGEYDWASGRFSGYGFVDKSLKGDLVITDHEVRAQVAGPFYASVEVGYNRFGGAMGKVGVGVNLTKLPVVRDGFVYLQVYAQKTVFGPDADHLVGTSWGTKDLRLTKGVAVYASGFADIKHNEPDVVQTQLWLKFDHSPVEIGGEWAFFGKQQSVSAAVKFKF